MDDYEPMSLFWRCYGKFGSALEEYVEACSFLVFLTNGTLVTQQWIADAIAEDFREIHRVRLAASLSHADESASLHDGIDAANSNADEMLLQQQSPSSRLTAQQGKTAVEADTASGCGSQCGCERLEAAIQAIPVPTFNVPFREYFLGIFDLGGEVMRFATSNASSMPPWLIKEGEELGAENDVCNTCAAFLAELHPFMQKMQLTHGRTLKIRGRDTSKVDAMAQSVQKLEKLSFQWTTRRSEYGPEIIEKMMKMKSRERPDEEAVE
jgi:hypothetical protein